MEKVDGILHKFLAKSAGIFSTKSSSKEDYVNVPKEEVEEDCSDEVYELGGKACMSGEETTGEDEMGECKWTQSENIEDVDKKQKTSSLQAAWNISNLIQGTGTLGIPYAVSQGGYLSLVAIVIIALITNYTGKLIIECLYEKPEGDDGKRGRRLRNSYAELGQTCWNRNGALLVCGAQIMQLTCACALYLMLVADFFNDVFEERPISVTAWMLLSGLLVLPSVFINQLSRISWLSMFSVFALVVVFMAVVGYGLSQRHAWDSHMPLTTLGGFPVSWGIILFSFVSHPYLPGIEETMSSPESFDSVMNYSFFISAITKVVYGFVAVLTFKENTKQEISENLPPGVLENSTNALLGLNGLFSFALPAFTLFNVFDNLKMPCLPRCFPDEVSGPLDSYEKTRIYSLRVVFVGVVIAIAVLIPEFSLLMAVIGSLSGVCLTLIFPPLFDVILNLNSISPAKYVLNMVIVCVGILSGGFGFVFSVIALMKVYLRGT
ncbi:hypothetical protein QZH41_017210 [Actinostola sp. cb2023]|nr:hypothetical protein QZH41_017210 [Actinostola sp. cb2023]